MDILILPKVLEENKILKEDFTYIFLDIPLEKIRERMISRWDDITGDDYENRIESSFPTGFFKNFLSIPFLHGYARVHPFLFLRKSKSSKVVTLILMILAMNTIYMLPYLMYTYYTPLQEAMGLIGRDADYGRLLNVYGIANVILYLPGGWVADKFDCKKLLVFSMVSTGVLGIFF